MIITNGCSLSAGDYENTNDSVERAWPTKLGKILKTPVTNLSLGGSSNKRILRTTLEYLNTYSSFDGTIIIAWTNFLRNEFIWRETFFSKPEKLNSESYNQKKIFQANINFTKQSKKLNDFLNLYYNYSHDEDYEKEIWSQQVLLFQNYLEMRKINFYFFFSLDDLPVNSYTRQYDQSRWLTFEDKNSFDFLIGKGFKTGKCNHFDHDGNLFLAETISVFLRKQSLTIGFNNEI